MITDLFYQLFSYVDVTTFILLTVLLCLSWKFYTSLDLPPGPWGLPVVGYLLFLGRKPPEESFADLCKKYGPVMSLQLGSSLVIVLGNYEVIKEAFIKQGDNFAGRPSGPVIKINENDAGILNNDGDDWKEHRRFILSTLKDYGVGKLSLEPKILEEIHYFLDEVANHTGEPFDILSMLSMSTANIICTLEFGERFAYNDQRFIQYLNLLDEAINLLSNVGIRGFFPWIEYVPFSDRITKLTQIRGIQHDLLAFVNDQLEQHRKEYNEDSRKDLTDAYITEQKSRIEKYGTEGFFIDHEIRFNLAIMFNAGTETITSTLRWAFLMMMAHPEIQSKVQREIDNVIGMERDPTMSDKGNMIYTEAVLLEVQRFGSVSAFGIPHANIEATTLSGFRIPKRTVIMANLWAVHHDPQLWDQPEEFKPERFINKDGKIDKPEYLIAFSLGKRFCVGESLARSELFLYFTSLLQRFTLQAPKGTAVSMEYESVLVRRPKPYKCCAVQRQGYCGQQQIKTTT